MTENSALDTTIHEPSMTVGEVDMLLFALERSRAQFAWKCGGLDSAGLNQAHPPSTMTLGGILKHLAFVDDWTAVRLTAHPMPEPWNAVDWDAGPEWPWHSAADDPPEQLYRLWGEAAARCRGAVAEVLADGGLDRPDRQIPRGPGGRAGPRKEAARGGWRRLAAAYCGHLSPADVR